MKTLFESLNHNPVELKFGTSGRRGLIKDLTQLEIYINVRAELDYLQSLKRKKGGIKRGDYFYIAYDLRLSSETILTAVIRAIIDAEMIPINLGCIPTPALTLFSIEHGKGSIMVTGSHIPEDQNGYKCNTSIGELLKKHEKPIQLLVIKFRYIFYKDQFSKSIFNECGAFKYNIKYNIENIPDARIKYLERYKDFFANKSLNGKSILVYQHSAVGRDILVEILKELGANVIVAGRSNNFIPIDTENMDEEKLAKIQTIFEAENIHQKNIEAIVSTDGDSDRPLILGIENGKVKFFNGDLVGMIVAEFLKADAVVVPITCNDAIDKDYLDKRVSIKKTKVGSPFVIEGMEEALKDGFKRVCGWEANGGFLLNSDFELNGRLLKKLPTRDAFLPILVVLFAAQTKNQSINKLFAALPKRYSSAGLLKNFSREKGQKIIKQFANIQSLTNPFAKIGTINYINTIDGIRIYFENGDIAHIRPSGNSDEMRIYAVADSPERANEIVRIGIAEPDGIIRNLEKRLNLM